MNSLYPLVSICTPTFNRRPFIPILLDLVRRQDWPLNALEWIIVDDGTDKIQDILESAPDLKACIRYFPIENKMTLGAKRNFMHKQTRGDFIVYMDDDDYYPPCRIRHAVEMLVKNPGKLCAGSSIIHIHFPHLQKIVKLGPYGAFHATAGTFAFRKELLKITEYEETACLAEEKHFLKNYTLPMVQLDSMKTILVFSHRHNTFDKKKILVKNSPYVHESTLEVADFIQEKHIREFFTEKLETMLINYPLGEPCMKPDVLKQTLALSSNQNVDLIGKTPTLQEAMEIIRQQETKILQLNDIIKKDRDFIQKQNEYIETLKKPPPQRLVPFIEKPRRKKSMPEVIIVL